MRTICFSGRISLLMRREQDAYRSQFFDLLVERGYGLFEHLSMCRQDGTAEVLFRPCSRQFQRTPSLFSHSGLGSHISLGGCRPPLRFFLLGFNEL